MSIRKRLSTKPPKWARIIRNVGIALGSVSAFVFAAPIALPATVVTLAGYAAFGSGLIAAVCQMPNESK